MIKGHEGHPEFADPFDIPFFRDQTAAYRQLKSSALTYRVVGQKFSQARKMLIREQLGVVLTQKDYYNLVRREPLRAQNQDSAVALLKALDDAGFTFETFEEVVYEGDTAISRKLVQIVFWLLDGVNLIRRFCSGHLIEADATFRTNDKRIPLITSVGLTNENEQFAVAFSYCSGETAVSYSNFFSVLNSEIFTDGIPPPKVALTDDSAGMRSAVANGALPTGTIHQLCNWHARSAMVTRIWKGGYKEIEMKGRQVDNGYIAGIIDFIWDYVKSETARALQYNRQRLLDSLLAPEKAYLQEYYIPKEKQFVALYQAMNPNLSASSTQQNKVLHSTFTELLHGQMPLEKSVEALCSRTRSNYEKLLRKETQSITQQPTGLHLEHFQQLRGKVSLFALRRIEIEYLKLSTAEVTIVDFANYDLEMNYESCQCVNRLRYSLPCYHVLIPFARDALPSIPLQLIHPRWRLKPRYSDEWFIAPSDWRPSYFSRPLLLSPKKAEAHSDFSKVIEIYEALPQKEKNRYSRQIKSTLQNLHTIGQSHSHMANLPLGQPDAVPKTTFKRKRQSEQSRALTAGESGIEERRQQAREERRQARDAAIDEARRQQHPGNDSQLGPSAGFSLISDIVFDVDRDDYESPPPPPWPTQRKPLKAPRPPAALVIGKS